jgi:methylenetetrahydrofolate--tRNA-(uracil-5-)-methyltransferase
MRPHHATGAHTGSGLAELVCSNSLGSNLFDRASGLLKEELTRLGSMLLDTAIQSAVPAGNALAVDRETFSALVTHRISTHPRIHLIRSEVTKIPLGPTVIASGPLTSPALTAAIQDLTGADNLFFYDAIAPVVRADTINMDVAYRASRYDFDHPNQGDYINCPFTLEEYERFVTELLTAQRIELRSFELMLEDGVQAGSGKFFEGCLPIEIIARRGTQSLAYGPLRPVGLHDPRTGKGPRAALQLRQDDLAGTLYNLVGCQTNLTFPEQKRIFSLVPGLENAEIVRYGQMHRNTFIAAPSLLLPTLQFNRRPNLLFSGQITGVEGYMGNIATGLFAGLNIARIFKGLQPVTLPVDTMLGALLHYVTSASLRDFQPMKAIFGILPPLPNLPRSKRERSMVYVTRARNALTHWANEHMIPLRETGPAHET